MPGGHGGAAGRRSRPGRARTPGRRRGSAAMISVFDLFTSASGRPARTRSGRCGPRARSSTGLQGRRAARRHGAGAGRAVRLARRHRPRPRQRPGGAARAGGRGRRRRSTPTRSGRGSRGSGPQRRLDAARRARGRLRPGPGPGAAPPPVAAVPPERHDLRGVRRGRRRAARAHLLLGRRRLRGRRGGGRRGPDQAGRHPRCGTRSAPGRELLDVTDARPGCRSAR